MGLRSARWRVQTRLDTLTLFQKVVIANSLVIVSGAIADTWITKTLVER